MALSARVQKILNEAAAFTPAERAELAAEFSKPLVFTDADMDRQRRAILEFLSVVTVSGTDPDTSSDKYAVLKHHVEV
ncbi:MAG TPA: hypothetical protein VHO06_27160 [Polyangia bacterium]|nr:hypothetical protein [Polyangia bacterium]